MRAALVLLFLVLQAVAAFKAGQASATLPPRSRVVWIEAPCSPSFDPGVSTALEAIARAETAREFDRWSRETERLAGVQP